MEDVAVRQRMRGEAARIADIVAPVCAGHPIVKQLYLFGSRARGTHRSSSDYDLYAVLDYDEMTSLAPYLSVIDELERALKGHVDFISGEVWSARDALLKREIDRDKELLYDRDAQ